MQDLNADEKELAKFSELAHRWWDPESEFKPLHDINPLRLDWIDEAVSLQGKEVLDVGCGGGLLSEAMAGRGAAVCGIDLSEKALKVARLHLHESGLKVDYRLVSAEDFAAENPARFDAITCMEMLEHVPDPSSVIAACAKMLKPGGKLFLSTLNRTPKSYLFAIIGAEYVLGMLPKGTHDYAKFIRPSELVSLVRGAGLETEAICGMSYDPLSKTYSLCADVSVNYLVRTSRPA